MTISAFFGVIVFWLISSNSLEKYYLLLPTVAQNFWIAIMVIIGAFGSDIASSEVLAKNLEHNALPSSLTAATHEGFSALWKSAVS